MIAAGGTGAKVLESLVHFCAAGLGPEKAHVLLVEGDATALSRTRLQSLVGVYNQLERWPWDVKPGAAAPDPVKLFKTSISFYQLAQGFAPAGMPNMNAALGNDQEFIKVLSTLLSTQEMANSLTHGFHGCPNLGNFVVAEYLRKNFTIPGGDAGSAVAFLNALRSRLTLAPENPPTVVVVGSIFGGTGASILPLAQDIMTEILADPNNPANTPQINVAAPHIKWSRVLMLPYYNVEHAPHRQAGDPDPDRHSLDSVFALWYYQQVTMMTPDAPFFVVGSELAAKPTRKIPYATGGMAQKVPPFFPEVLGAIGILDLVNQPAAAPGALVARHFTNLAPENPAFREIPAFRAGAAAPSALATTVGQRQRLALLLHLAGFYLRHGEEHLPEFQRGLRQYAIGAKITGWNRDTDRIYKNYRNAFGGTAGPDHQMVEYFSRLLLWAASVFSVDGSGVTIDPDQNYAGIHNTMCSVESKEISPGDKPDNVVANVCRVAVAAFIREDQSLHDRNHRGHSFGPARPLVTAGGEVELALGTPEAAQALAHLDVTETAVWVEQYKN